MKKKNKDIYGVIEDEMYSLIGQIDYGDISNLDVYWSSLSNALTDLNIDGWKAKSFQDQSVSDVLSSMKLDFISKDLIETVSQMEELSHGGSSDSIDEDDLEKIQDLAQDLETLFLEFIEKLKVTYGTQ